MMPSLNETCQDHCYRRQVSGRCSPRQARVAVVHDEVHRLGKGISGSKKWAKRDRLKRCSTHSKITLSTAIEPCIIEIIVGCGSLDTLIKMLHCSVPPCTRDKVLIWFFSAQPRRASATS